MNERLEEAHTVVPSVLSSTSMPTPQDIKAVSSSRASHPGSFLANFVAEIPSFKSNSEPIPSHPRVSKRRAVLCPGSRVPQHKKQHNTPEQE